MGGAWTTVSGRFVRVVENQVEPAEMFDFVHRRPDQWIFEAPNSDARLVAAGGLVGLRHPDGWTARVPGQILADRVESLLTYDPTMQPVQLQLLSHEEMNGRRVGRWRWQRSDRDLTGEIIIDESARIVLWWQNDAGRSERIDELVIDGDSADSAGDVLLTDAPTEQKVGEAHIHPRGDEVRVIWHVSVPGLPAVQAQPPEFTSLTQAVDWARANARVVSIDRRLGPPAVNEQ